MASVSLHDSRSCVAFSGWADKQVQCLPYDPVEAADPQRVFLENFTGGSMEGHAGEGWWVQMASDGHCLQYNPSGHAPAPGEGSI